MRQGLYDAASEHDACGIGMVVNIRGDKTHELVVRALEAELGVSAPALKSIIA